MRIDDQNLTGISTSQTGRAQETEAGQGQGRASGAGKSGGDQVQLSALAGNLQALASDSPERAERLEKLTAEVEAGRYQVDAQELSRKIVEDALGERT